MKVYKPKDGDIVWLDEELVSLCDGMCDGRTEPDWSMTDWPNNGATSAFDPIEDAKRVRAVLKFVNGYTRKAWSEMDDAERKASVKASVKRNVKRI